VKYCVLIFVGGRRDRAITDHPTVGLTDLSLFVWIHRVSLFRGKSDPDEDFPTIDPFTRVTKAIGAALAIQIWKRWSFSAFARLGVGVGITG